MSAIMSDGDYITAVASTARPGSRSTHVVVTIDGGETASIWLTPEQADELIREISAARVEISKARPKS